MNGIGHRIFGEPRRRPAAEALLHDARAAAREELELHEQLMASDWLDESFRELRDRVAPEFLARNARVAPGALSEAAAAAEERLTRHGAGRLDLRTYQLLADLARAAADLS